MKARAWLLLLLIGMMSFTGFSTTTDLNQNSDAVTISDYDVGDQVTAIIVVKSDLNVTEDKIEFIDVRYTEVLSQQILSNNLIISSTTKTNKAKNLKIRNND